MKAISALLVLAALAGPQETPGPGPGPVRDRWKKGGEEERLKALREAASFRKQWGDAALATFAEAPVPETWSRPDALMDLVGRDKIVSWYALLLPLLRHADAAVRSRAAEELARRDLRRYSPSVVPLLRDKDIRVAWQAAFTLVEMEARERVVEVAPLMKDGEGSVRLNVLHVLGRLGSREHGPLLAPLLDDADAAIQSSAIQVLGRFGAREFSGRVARFLESADPVLRQEAVAALGGMGARDTAKQIAERLTDGEILVRWEAVRTLGKLKAREYAGAIAAMNDEEGAEAPVLEALGELGLRELAPQILPSLDIPDAGIRWRAVKALGCVDAKNDTDSMVRMLKDPDSYVRRCALQALAAVGAKQRSEEMLALLRDEEAEVCEVAAEESCLLANAAQLKSAEALLDDEDPFIRWSALHLLAGAGCRAALPALDRHLCSGGAANGDVLWAYGRLDARDRRDGVLEAARKEEGFVRQQAVFAYARLGGRPEDLDAVERDAQGALKLAAGFALVRLGRKDRAAASALLKDLGVQRDEADYQLFPEEVFDALAAGFEKDLDALLSRELKAEKRVESVDTLRTLVLAAGVTLAPDDTLELKRRLPAGTTTTVRRALEWSFGSGMRLVPSQGKILVLDSLRAVEHWQKRLDAP